MGRPVGQTPAAFFAAVAGRLVQMRKAAGWTQAGLAERMGVDNSTLSRIERGEAAPSLTKIVKAAGVFGVAPFELLQVDAPLPAFDPAPADAAPLIEAWHRLDQHHRDVLLDIARSFATAGERVSAPPPMPQAAPALAADAPDRDSDE